ncbi:MAG: arginine deiminase-related protein [bacterium]
MTGKRSRLVLPILLLVAGCVSVAPQQTTDTVFMVCPDDFAYNPETAKSNVFQHRLEDPAEAQRQAVAEFERMVKTLEAAGVRVVHVHSRRDVKTPDAVFPNNWFSVHRTADGNNVLVVYPMLAPDRRAERRVDLVKEKLRSCGIVISRVINLANYETQGKFLEGTGSMVLDRVHRVAFASLSPRTDPDVLEEFCRELDYRPFSFHSHDSGGKLIYHTNVMMSVGEEFAIVCAEAIKDEAERSAVLGKLDNLGKKIIRISLDQTRNMCGNVLELHSRDGTKVIVMSKTAYDHFTEEQRAELATFGTLVPVDITTIETIGGGSARCMIAEIF